MDLSDIVHSRLRMPVVVALGLLLFSAPAGAVESQIVAPGDGYGATDLLPDEWVDLFCVFGDSQKMGRA